MTAWPKAACRLSVALAMFVTIISNAQAATCRISEVTSPTITCSSKKINVKTDSEAYKTAIAKLMPGTIIEVPAPNTSAADVQVAKACVGGFLTSMAILLGIVIALTYAWLITGSAVLPNGYKNLLALLIGQDNRYSNSKVQVVGWMGVLLITYVAITFLRWWSGMLWQEATSVGISGNLLTMAGLSAAAAGGAKLTTATKITTAAPTDATKKDGSARPHFWHDLFRNDDGMWDLGDAQMIVVTAVSIGLFLVDVGNLWADLPLAAHIDLPSPTNPLTFALGGSLGGYLAKKIGGPVGQT